MDFFSPDLIPLQGGYRVRANAYFSSQNSAPNYFAHLTILYAITTTITKSMTATITTITVNVATRKK